MAVPFWLKMLLPLLIFVAFFRALIGAGELDLYKIFVEFGNFEFDTTGIKKIISLFENEDYRDLDTDISNYPMGDFPNADGYWDDLPNGGGDILSSGDSVELEPLFAVIPPVEMPDLELEYDSDGDGVADSAVTSDDWFSSFWDGVVSFFEDVLTFFEGIWLTLSEFFSLLGRVFVLVFKVLGLA